MGLSSTMTEIIESGRVVRLGCYDCDRSDFEFITVEQLAAAIAAGWEDVREIQSLAESIDEDPPRGTLLDWETHRGICPDCLRKGG